MEPKDLNEAADIYAEPSPEEESSFTSEEPASGVHKRGPRKRGAAPSFSPKKSNRAKGGGHRDDPTVRTRPLPDWMNDPSLLPKKPPGRT